MKTRAAALTTAGLIALLGFAVPDRVVVAKGAAALEEIVVTARKREESLQDVPISVSAFTSAQIRDLGVTNLSALSDFTPGFSFETFGGRRGAEGDVSRPVIRGQSNILGESNVAIFVDGIIYSESIMSFPFDIIDRVEVIKGPQAAQFGRATFAGAVNIITKRGTNDFENLATARLAQDDDYELNLSSRGPLIRDRLFYFVHGRYYDYGGEYKNELDGRTVGGESSWGLNAGLDFQATDDLMLRLSLGYNEDDDEIPAQRVQDRFANNCFLDQARQYYCGEVHHFDSVRLALDRLDGEAGLDREVFRGTGTLEWNIAGSGFTLTSNTGVISADSSFGNDQTYLGDPIQFLGGQFVRVEDSNRDEWSTELRLASPVDSRIRYQVGAYYYDREIDRVRRFPGTSNIITDFGTEGVEDVAGFASVEVDLADRLTAGLELRYQKDTIFLEPAAGGRLEEEFTATLPRFTLDYRVTDALLLYANVAKGNKPGAINTDPRLPPELQKADEEEAWNYELGVKTDLAGGRVRLNAAVYYIDWSQQQLTQSVIINDLPISVITNAGKTRVEGFEVEATALLTDNWRASLGYAYADAEFRDFCDPVQGAELTGFDCVAPTGTPGGQVKGNQTPNSPESQFNADTTYQYPLTPSLDLYLRADYSYQSKKYAQVHNLAYVGDRNLLNLKVGLRTDVWSATLFVDNVLDDLTPSTVVRFADLANLNIGPNVNPAQDNVPGTTSVERGFLVPLARGRQAGITLSYRF
jgi:iron complex outermembrane recepter protein